MSKIPLILVPGLLCDKEVWAKQINSLRDIADIVVADLSKATTPEAMVDAVFSVAPSERFCLAGHSMGAWIAAEVAVRHPERVTKLCIISTSVAADTNVKAAHRHELINQVSQGQIESVIDQLVDSFIFNETIRPSVKRILTRNAPTFINQESAMLLRRNNLPLLKIIKCPTLIIHAENDKIFSLEDAKAIQTNIPHAKIEIVKDSGHMVIMEKPDIVSELMRVWLIQKL